MRPRTSAATCAGAPCSGPAGVQAIRRSHSKHTNIAPVPCNPARCVDGFRGNRSLIGDHDLGVRPWFPQPIGAINDAL